MAGCNFSCSIGSGDSEVSIAELEQRISASYENETGAKLTSLECEEPEAEVGEPISCQGANASGVELQIGGEVTGIDETDDTILFDWEVVSATAPGAAFSDAAKKALEREVGEPLRAVQCPERVPLERGTEVRCAVVTDDGRRLGATMTMTDGEGGFRINLDEAAQA